MATAMAMAMAMRTDLSWESGLLALEETAAARVLLLRERGVRGLRRLPDLKGARGRERRAELALMHLLLVFRK